MYYQRFLRTGVYCVLIAVAAAFLPVNVASITAPELSTLGDGQYAVGFKTIESYDYTRTFSASRDYFGDQIEGEVARPFQLCLWYPATATADDTRLTLGEYAFPYPADENFFDFVSQLQTRENGRLQGIFRNLSLVLSLLGSEASAVRDAAPVEGKFPAVILSGDRTTDILDNAPLAEYLASHGYVVAILHSVGTTSLNPQADLRNLETQARDMQLALSIIRQQPQVNVSKVAVGGSAFGAQAALITAMRDSRVAAAILEGRLSSMGESEPAVHSHPDFDTSRLTVPVLYVGQDDGLPDTFPYADRVSAVSHGLPAMAASYYGLIQALAPGADSTQLPQMIQAYQQVCHHVHDFLAWQFESDPDAQARITGTKTAANDNFQISYTKAEPRPPTADELLAILQTKGVATAKEILDRFGLPTRENPVLTEAVYNVTGYQFLQRGDPASAVTILQWATIIAPGSANAWDSYAEACLAAGDRETALSASRKSLELIPTDSTSGDALLNILRETVPQRISDLEAETN